MNHFVTWMLARRRFGLWGLLLPVAWRYRHEIAQGLRTVMDSAQARLSPGANRRPQGQRTSA